MTGAFVRGCERGKTRREVLSAARQQGGCGAQGCPPRAPVTRLCALPELAGSAAKLLGADGELTAVLSHAKAQKTLKPPDARNVVSKRDVLQSGVACAVPLRVTS